MTKGTARGLSDKRVAELPPAAPGKRYIEWDDLQSHFGILVTDKGAQTWKVIKRMQGGSPHPIVHTLGKMPVKKARKLARDVIQQLDDGTYKSPKQVKAEQARQAAENCDVLVAAFIKHLQKLKRRRWRAVEFCLRKDFLGQRRIKNDKGQTVWVNASPPIFRNKPALSITRGDILARVRAIHDEREKYAARHALGNVRACFNWGSNNEVCGLQPGHSPAVGLSDRKNLGVESNDLYRDRTLSDDELRSVWECAKQYPYPFGPLLRLLLLSGQRVSDISEAKRTDIHVIEGGKCLVVERERYKNKFVHEIPLVDAALDIIDSLPVQAAGPYLFSVSGGKRSWRNMSDATDKFRALVDKHHGTPLKPWVLHDLRRTCRSYIDDELDVSDVTGERVIGHRQQGLRRHYVHSRHLRKKRRALEAWTAYVLSVVEPSPDNVVSLEQARA